MLDKEYWDNRYSNKDTGWDIGYPSTPLKEYIDQLEDKNIKVLIPGAGNGYEAEHLHIKGFTNVHLLDISPAPLESFSKRVPAFPKEHLICEDFFKHDSRYDLIIEQTFFCALDPSLREKYVEHMHKLLAPAGKLVGLLFNDKLNDDKPPFGGSADEYKELFGKLFTARYFGTAYNSIEPRTGRELFVSFKRK